MREREAMLPTVLLVEDHYSDRMLLATACERAGLRVAWETAASCQNARHMLNRRQLEGRPPPALAILDQRLPDGLGTDLLPVLQQIYPGMPMVLFTVSDARVDHRRIPVDCPTTYLVKPFSMAGYRPLLDHIAAVLAD